MTDEERREAERLGAIWSENKLFRLDHIKAYVTGYAAALEAFKTKTHDIKCPLCKGNFWLTLDKPLQKDAYIVKGHRD